MLKHLLQVLAPFRAVGSVSERHQKIQCLLPMFNDGKYVTEWQLVKCMLYYRVYVLAIRVWVVGGNAAAYKGKC